MTTGTTGVAHSAVPESTGFGPVLAEMANTLAPELTHEQQRAEEARQAWETLQKGLKALNMPALDATDPRTPALVFFSSEGCDARYGDRNFELLLVWRKSTDEYKFVVNPGNSTRPRLRHPMEFLSDGFKLRATATWATVRFRDVDGYVRHQLLGDNDYSMARRATASVGRMCAVNPGASLKGQRGWHNYTRERREIAEWSDTIKEALAEYKEKQWRGQHQVKEELRDESVSGQWRSKWVDAVNAAFGNAGEDEPLVMCDCGHVEVDGESHETAGGSTFCDGCVDDYRMVDDEWYHEDDVYYWESDGEYHTEEEPEEDDEDEDDSSNLIRSWGASTDSLCHDRSFTSSTMGDFIMGVELEVESSHGNLQAAAESTFDYFDSAKRHYATLKEDGSLSSYGFEIVTAARKLQDHLELFSDWKPHRSLSAWNPGTCGVHVHIDSRAFSGMTLGKFLMFINSDCNQSLIKSIAGRHPNTDSKAQSYCAKLGQAVLDTPSKALKAEHGDRYRMVNLCNLSYDEQSRLKTPSVYRNSKGNYSTVELRIFKASLRKERLLSQLEFTHAAVMFCRVSSWSDLNSAGFHKWLKGAAGAYKNLAHWYGINVPKANTKTPASAVVSTDETV